MKSTHNNIKSIRKILDNMNFYRTVEFYKSGALNFKRFLNTLNDTVICMKLHPAVTNVYWDKIHFLSYDTVFRHTVDFKLLKTKYQIFSNNKPLCARIERIKDPLDCYQTTEGCDSFSLDTLFNDKYYEPVNSVYNEVAHII